MKVAEQLPGNSASMIGGMHLFQRVKRDQVSFGDVATTVVSVALSEGAESDRIDVVFDTYAIKNCERILRGGEAGHQLQSIACTHLLRQWRHFLSTANNKTRLISFIVGEWRKPQYRETLYGKVLHATVNDNCYQIISHGGK